MSCERKSKTNGQVSILFDALFNIVNNENEADALYSYFNEPGFLEIFGDYKAYYKSGSPKVKKEDKELSKRLDDNGEPALFYSSKLNKYFFIDKNNEPVFYPYKSQGLNKHFNINDIKLFSEILSLNFYMDNIEFDYDRLEFQNKSTKQLKTFIQEYIEKKSSELLTSDDINEFSKGIALEESLDNIDEWVNEVKNYFKTLNINYSIEENEDQEAQEEAPSGELMRKESFLKSSKDNINNNVKLYLSLFKTNKKNSFGEYDFYSFDKIYSILNKTLSNQIAVEDENGHLEDIFDVYIDKITKLENIDPIFSQVKDKFLTIEKDSDFKYQIISAFNLYKNNFLASETSKDVTEENGTIINYTIRNISEVGSRKKNILGEWEFNNEQKKLTTTDLKDILKNNTKLLNDVVNNKDIQNEDDLIPYFQEFKEILNSLGVNFTLEGFDLFLNELDIEEHTFKARYKTFRKALKDLTHGINNAIDNEVNILSDQSLFTKLAEAEAFLQEEGSDASVFSGMGTKWVYSLPSYIDLKVAKWKKNPSSLRKLYEASDYNNTSLWMEYLTAADVSEEIREETSRERLEAMEVGIFNSIQQEGDAMNAVDNKNISYVDSLVDYVNKILAFKKKGKVYHKTALAAGKGTEYQIYYGTKSGVFNLQTNASFDKQNDRVIVDSSITDIFFNYVNGEYKRIKRARLDISEGKDLVNNYHTGKSNALKMQLFKSLSHGKIKDILIYDQVGMPIYDDLSSNKEVELQIREYINKVLDKNIRDARSKLISENVFKYDENGNLVNNAIDSSIYNSYDGNKSLKIAADMFVNSVVSQIEYAKMFTGDPAYYKDPADYKKRVPATYTDGLYMALNNDEKYFNASIIENVYMDAPSLEALKKYMPEHIWKQYSEKKVNATDAQAWITPQRWKFILKRIGKWNTEKDEIYKKMLNPNATYTKKELKIVAQPLKGVYFDIDANGRPVFLKYSQAVLVQNLVKDTGLETLYKEMVYDKDGKQRKFNSQIHEVIVQDGIKVGAPSNVTTTHDSNGNMLDSFKLNKLKLNNSGWKLQQDLPTKGFKDTVLGSQIQKNIYQGLVYNDEAIFDLEDGSTKSNTEMIEYLNDLVGALSNKGMQSVIKRLGINKDTLEIENEEALYSSIITQLKTRRDVPSNFIKALEAGISPYGIPGGFRIFQNVFSSIVNNEIVKIKTNGAGLIQMSDYGLSKSEAKSKGVLFTPWFNSANGKLSMPEIYTDVITGKEKLTPSGIFLSGSLIAKYVPDYKKYSSEKLFGTLNEETGKYEGGIIDQKILTNIIGYRIPNQGLPSNDALQVMGILPEEVGDVIIPYTGITTKTGSDFDIDKMYLMIPAFNAKFPKKDIAKGSQYIRDNKITRREIVDILESLSYPDIGQEEDKLIYDTFIKEILLTESETEKNYYEDFNNNHDYRPNAYKLEYIETLRDENNVEYPMYQQPIKALQNKLIEAYKSILLNKDVVSDVFLSLDVSKIKDDVKNLNQETSKFDMLDFDAITDLKLKNEFVLGKAGLGQNVNSLVDAVRGAMGDLSLNDVKLGWGHVNKDGDTSFDSEFSEELSDTELLDYMKSFNEDNNEENKKELTKEQVFKFKKIKLFESLMELVNAFVDIEKDPYIVKANWVTQTNNVGFLLLRAGVHPFKVNAFLSQPILKEYVNYKDNQESRSINNSNKIEQRFLKDKASEIYDKQGENITINDITLNRKKIIDLILTDKVLRKVKNIPELDATVEEIEDYNKSKSELYTSIKSKIGSTFKLPVTNDRVIELSDEIYELYESVFEATPVDFKSITLKTLRDNIKKEEDIRLQLSILEKFINLQKHAKVLTNNVSASKPDVDGKGKNINSLIISRNKIENILDDTFTSGKLHGFNSKLEYNGKPTMLKTYVDNSLYKIYDIMRANPKFFLGASNMAVSSFNEVSDKVYGTSLENAALGDKLENNYYTYILSGFKPLQVPKENREEFLLNMPQKLSDIKKEVKDNPLLNELYLKSSDFKSMFFISMSNVRKSVSRKNDITDGWKDLLETHPQFAEDLIKYSYLISGFNNTINQFHEFIPYEWFNKNRFNSYLKELGINKDILDRNFIDQFFRHSKNDATLNKRVFSNEMVELQSGDNFMTGYIAKRKQKITPYLTHYNTEYGTRYYKLIGYTPEEKAIYLRTSLLGFSDKRGNKVFEYDLGVGKKIAGSIFKNNKLTSKMVNVELRQQYLNKEDIISAYNSDMIVDNNESTRTYDREAEDVFTKKPEKDLVVSEKSSTFVERMKSINVYWGQPESSRSTRILSNLAPRKFNYKSTDDITREYGSVEHAYQSNKSGTFNKKTYDAYNSLEEIPNRQGKGWGRKIAPKVSVEQMKAADSLGLMKKLVVESFKQNSNSEAAKKLMQYENFTHNTNQLIDQAFLEGLKLAQIELSTGNIDPETGQTSFNFC